MTKNQLLTSTEFSDVNRHVFKKKKYIIKCAKNVK